MLQIALDSKAIRLIASYQEKLSLMPKRPVVVVGASSAGLYAAYLLAQQKLPVRVYEASPHLAAEPRTLIVTAEFTRALSLPARGVIRNEIRQMALFSPSARAQVALAQPDLVIERRGLIELLAAEAQTAGAELCLGYRFVGLAAEGPSGQLSIRLVNEATGRQEQVTASALIGADGLHSQVARAAGLAAVPAIANLQAEVALPENFTPDTACVWFAPHDTRFFYWLIPQSAERAVVGLAADSMAQARECLARFLKARDWHPLAYQAETVAGHRFGYRPWARIGHARVYLVGDAAGQVKVTTVGGVVTGLWGARAAAQAIAGQPEHKATLARLSRELDWHTLLRGLLDRFSPADYDTLLRLLNQRTLALLRTHTRDQFTHMIWRLLLAQPRWLPFLARLLAHSLQRQPMAGRPVWEQ
jgi:flavin-dependent dehydrogenase